MNTADKVDKKRREREVVVEGVVVFFCFLVFCSHFLYTYSIVGGGKKKVLPVVKCFFF